MIIVISGPSGVGKGTIARELIKRDKKVKLAVTCTTRAKRKNEIDKRDYYFLSEEEFFDRIKRSEFAEYSVVHGKHYGVLKKSIEERLSDEKDILLQIDVQGAKKIKNQYGQALLIFIMPPSIKDLLKRLNKRGTETPEEEEHRIKRAKEEIEERFFYDFVVVNNKIGRAVSKIFNIIRTEREKRLNACK